ncbi:nuclear transport factor 2 family protein [Plantactinospora sp. GCM10030261]|uniref:nuclear transport factor 2 family protein n=1 Tax=Plantactinospora sp. GCM10030261 TaxID=3273420 RepID=UPI0036100EFD
MSVAKVRVRGVDDTSISRRTARAYVDLLERRDWTGLAALLTDDVVYEMPQTRERIRGKDGFLRFNAEYPGDWHLQVRRVIADRRFAALWLDVQVGIGQQDACVWLQMSEHGLISKIVDYWPEPYDPPPGREHLVERW